MSNARPTIPGPSPDRDAAALRLWRAGYDTFDIARLLNVKEHDAVRMLNRAREYVRNQVEGVA